MIKSFIGLMALLLFALSLRGMQKCFICEGMVAEQFIALNCDHTYHPSCILMMCRGSNSACPLCKHPISAEQIVFFKHVKESSKPAPRVYRTYKKCFICDNRIPELLSEEFVLLNCEHAYHPTCILTWSRTNPTCPQCKHPITNAQMQYFEHIIQDDIPPVTASFLSKYKLRIIVGGCGIALVICYYYKNEIMAWLAQLKKKRLKKPQEIL